LVELISKGKGNFTTHRFGCYITKKKERERAAVV
jgi:hypothetical protein